MTDHELLEMICGELIAIRKAVSAKSGRPNLITVKRLIPQGGWDVKLAQDEIIDANKITQIEPFSFWTGGRSGNVAGAFIHFGKDSGMHVLHTPAEVKTLAEK